MVDPHLSVGASLGVNEILTPTKLHNLVEDATLSAMGVSALATGLDYVRGGAEGTPVAGDTYVDSAGLLQVYDGSAYNALGIAPAYTITLTNSSGVTLTRSMAVVIDPTVGATPPAVASMTKPILSTFNPTVIGLLWDSFVNPGDDGQVLVRGVMEDAIVFAIFGPRTREGSLLQGPSSAAAGGPYATIDNKPTTNGFEYSNAYFGMLLEEVDPTGLVTAAVYVWR
jgi:hypothetical protein